MKKIAIMTIKDDNYGNRLQNYAMQKLLSNYNFDVYTLIRRYNFKTLSIQKKFFYKFEKLISTFACFTKKYNIKAKRKLNFIEFNKKIKNVKNEIRKNTNLENLEKKFDFFVAGSDQIWNPNLFKDGLDINMLYFVPFNKKIAISPSIGVDNLNDYQKKEFCLYLKSFKMLSCRENQGSNIISEITGKECITLIDPTLMLSKNEWVQIEKKPSFYIKDKKYILLYFLGEITQEYGKFIKFICEKYNMDIIDICDKKSVYYSCGPSEFIYMINHSSLVLTDSFHASVFSYIFDKPLKVFNRIDGNKNMNSRLINLINVLKLPKSIIFDINDHDVDELFKTPNYDKTNLKKEQKKFYNYLNKAFK